MSAASLAELRRALDDSPTAMAHARLGTALLRAGDAGEAERHLRAAVDLDERCAPAWVNLGGILLARWEFVASIEANRRAAESDPGLALAHFNQAIGHLHLGQAAKALECLGRVVEIEPRNGAAYYHLAIALYALERADEARVCAAYAEELGYRPTRSSAEALERAAATAAGSGTGGAGSSQCSTSTSAEGEANGGFAQGR